MNFDLHAAARALDEKVIGQQIRCPGPNHSASDDSLSVKLEGDDIVVHSFAGDDVNTCKDYVRSRLGLPKWEKPANDDPIVNMQARAAKKPQPEPEHDPWTCITPIPDDAFPLDVKLGGKEPRSTWLFKDASGRVLGVECRWLKPDGKDIRFATWCRHDNGRTEWRLKHLPAPRPIFGLDRLKSAPLAPVLIVEGAKKVAPATKLFPDYVAIAWPAGAEGAKHVDWSPLKSREVVVWPDNDEAGRKAAVKIADLVMKAGADSASVVPVPTDFPPKWDLADKAPDGSDLAALLEAARPAKQVPPTWPAGFKMLDRGLVWSDPSEDEKPEIVVSGRFEVLAESRDDRGQSWGVLLRWADPDGRSREWAMPRSILATDGADVRRVLLDGGLYVGAGTKARNLLVNFLTGVHVEARARAVSATGWYGAAFVLPDGAIGKPNGERAILQTSGAVDHAFNVRGSLASWKAEVARYAVGNSRLVLAVSTALAAALVGPCGEESGGIHLRGPSSIGKTTALTLAGSVWGGGEQKYVRAWRATSNGLEAVATSHNDALLCLDELAQLGGREAGEVAYMLANGSGKARASRDAMLRKPAKWRLLFLSSGEISLADKLAEDVRGRKQTAGQKVRVVDVPADTGRHGLLEELHGFAEPGALAKHLTAAALLHYGTGARAFIEAIAPDLDGLRDAIKVSIRDFVAEHCPAGADGQVQRVAGRFALIAAAGEIATAVGVLPWQPGEALRGVQICFQAWIEARGGVESSEVKDGIAAVRSFLSAHGTSRFLAAWEDKTDETRIHNLAGYRRQVSDGEGSAYDFYVTTEAWSEVCAGFDPKALAATLIVRGFLKKPERGNHFGTKVRVPGHGSRRLYHISASIFGVKMRDLGAILQKARETAKNSGNVGNSGNGLENPGSINSLTKPAIVPTADMGVGTVGTDQIGVPTVPIDIEEVGTSSFDEITKQNQEFVQSVPTVPTVPTENSNSSKVLEQVTLNRCFVCGERETSDALFIAVLTSRPGEHHWLHHACHDEHIRRCAERRSRFVKSEPFGLGHLACCLDPRSC